MSRIFIDGFEHGSLDMWDWTGAGTSAQTNNVASGSYSLFCNYSLYGGDTASLRKILPGSPLTEVFVSFRYFPGGTGSQHTILEFRYGGSVLVSFVRDLASGYLKATRGLFNATVIAYGPIIQTGEYTHFEIRYIPNLTNGIIQVKVKDVLSIDYTGNTTSGFETLSTLAVFGSCTGGAYFDDIVVDTANWIGPSRIYGLTATSNGATNNWTPSSGSNYECVDERPPSDSDYVTTDGIGNLDLYTLSDLPGAAYGVKCVQVATRMYKEVSSTPQNVNLAVRTAGSNYFSSDIPVPDSVGVNLYNIWEENPDTLSAWTVSDINSLQAGYKAQT
jgi:hypothetical protein